MQLPDVINPLEGIVVGLFRKLVWVQWPRGMGATGWQMEKVLRERGVFVYGRMTNDPENLGFYVRATQAEWAQTLINKKLNKEKLPPPWNSKRALKPRTAIDAIVSFLAYVFDGDSK